MHETVGLIRLRLWLFVAGAMAATAALAAPAMGATTFGSNEAAAGPNCPVGSYVQVADPTGAQFGTPSDGVITQWYFRSSLTDPGTAQMKLKMFRPMGPDFLVVGESTPQTPPDGGALTTYDTRIPVQAGDRLGLAVLTFGICGNLGTDGQVQSVTGDPAPGTIAPGGGTVPGQLTAGATLEPDADNDEFGDETQDQCPSQAQTHGACLDLIFPETTITKGPKPKSTKTKAKFRFKSSEAGSSFQCKLKGKGLDQAVKQYAACTSPRKYTNLDSGKYKFFVFATDGAGNADASPAKRKFKVVE